ncbi:MAG: Phenylalanine--tRNA ligase beta subunit [Microgenomates bacterium OLB23]|nr:MAG: Phenylalanine--tRNA ligase beta subunit [Microgenomates bacterium OLB23]
MNFKLTHSMLLEFLDTDATPEQIQEYVSLGGPNVETVEQVGNEYVYDIEVTSNRIDAASAFGFALECTAILPRYNKTARLKLNPLREWTLNTIEKAHSHMPMHISLQQDDLAQRLMAVVLANVHVSKDPTDIGRLIELCDERSVNNVVDISNYVRIMLGHPVHMFDYDKIKKQVMNVRLSNKNESITTLDGKAFTLPGNDIVIEDGEGNLIDLAGIMGAKNTEISEDTQNILFFVPTFNGSYIRKTSMKTAQRSSAVAYFEKQVDTERAPSVLCFGAVLMQKLGAQISSDVIDMYPHHFKGVQVQAQVSYINTLMSTSLSAKDMVQLIEPLGFTSVQISNETISLDVPSYRAHDVRSQVDVAEEVARIYGYHNIPNTVLSGSPLMQPEQAEIMLKVNRQIRNYLSSIGYNEQYNYSMISKSLIEACKLHEENHLRLSNTISEEIEYMRTSLVPSLLKNIADNNGRATTFNFFECARTYVKQDNDLPIEDTVLALASTYDFFKVKGIVERLLAKLHIQLVTFAADADKPYLLKGMQAGIYSQGQCIGYIGAVAHSTLDTMSIPQKVCVAEINLSQLTTHIQAQPPYKTPHAFAKIKRDITYTSSPALTFNTLSSKAFAASAHILSLNVVSVYQSKVTVRFEFGFADKNMTDTEADEELKKITASVPELQ